MGWTHLTTRLEAMLPRRVVSVSPISGGDLSSVFRIQLEDGTELIAKQGNSAAVEGDMVKAIAATGAPAPEVVAVDADLLVMTALAADGALRGPAWASLSAALSALHCPTSERYGWRDNYSFGGVVIENGHSDDWPRFWAEHRLLCHLGHLPASLARRIEALAERLPELLPARPPASLLHGDLWGGNVLVSGTRISGLIDPACYHGDREVDVAMLTLFDHPPATLFEALDLDTGWRQRLPVYRLWPWLVHLRLFGDAYAGAVTHELDVLGL